MAIPKGKCCSTIVLPSFGVAPHTLPIPGTEVWTIIYKIGTTTIAGSTPTVSITFTTADNPGLTNPATAVATVQAKINADPVYQASGTTITVNSLNSVTGLSVTICKKAVKKIAQQAEGIFDITTLV